MHNNECTWKVVATTAANDFCYEDDEYDAFQCTGCLEDRDWCRCDEEN